MKRFTWLVIFVFLLAALACNVNVNVPTPQTGETQTLTVDEATPSGSDPAFVTIEMGAGELNIQPGAKGLVSGTVQYNVKDWKPSITRTGSDLRISQGNTGTVSLPGIDIENNWDLKLGSSPMRLLIKAGAYKGTLNLGGLALTELEVNDGASEAKLTFDAPNPQPMDRLTYKTGASKVEMTGLANANFTELNFNGGAGTFTLDFGGQLQRDGLVKITAGVSEVKLIIPDGVNAEVKVTGGVNNINTQGTWTVTDNVYTSGGSGPRLTIEVEMAVGSLKLMHQP